MPQEVLATYDPKWGERWERSNRLLKAMQERGEYGDSYQAYLGVLHAAYAAQFLTVEEVWAHDLKHAMFMARGSGVPVPELPAGATVAQAKALIARYRQDVDDAVNASDRPVPRDPAGLLAFTTPARRGCRRTVEPLALGQVGDGLPVRCLVLTETTADEAHVCFVWQKDGGSVCDEIERLATHVYRDRFSGSLARRVLQLGRSGRYYEPSRVSFHEYDPWHIKAGALRRLDHFTSIKLTWVEGLGFTAPEWKQLESVPPYVASLFPRR